MINKTLVFILQGLDPYTNLAVEELLLRHNQDNQCILILWQNDKTVVIGRNQNPWAECDLKSMETNDIKLARRITGGGAVYHDGGNLNFSFILGRDDYNVERQCDVIIGALAAFGLKAVRTGRNDMTLDERKFSGNAFCFLGNNALHHGTLLISANKENLARYLNVPIDKIESKGVTSVKSRVVNLCDIVPELTLSDVKNALLQSFAEEYGQPEAVITMNPQHVFDDETKKLLGGSRFDEAQFKEILEKQKSFEWRYGKTPSFDVSFKTRFAWGGIELGFKIREAVIREARVYSDALCEELIALLPEALEGSRLVMEELKQRLDPNARRYDHLEKDTEVKQQVLTEITAWLSDKLK